MKLVELSNMLFFKRAALKEGIISHYKKQNVAPSIKQMNNNKQYQELQTVNKLLSEIEGVLEHNHKMHNKYKGIEYITSIINQQRVLAATIKNQQLKQKSIRDNFLKYFENVLYLRNEPMTTKEVKQLAESVGYEVRNINDFLKVAITKSETIYKVKTGLYDSKRKLKLRVFS